MRVVNRERESGGKKEHEERVRNRERKRCVMNRQSMTFSKKENKKLKERKIC